MIFYYAFSIYHLLCCILHKLKYHSDHEAILALSGMFPYKKIIANLKASGVFKDISVIDDKEIITFVRNRIDPSTPARKIQSLVNENCRWVKKQLPYDLESFFEINIALDHWPIGIYLIRNKLRYNFFEDGCGCLSQNEYLAELLKSVSEGHFILAKEIGAFAENGFAQRKLGDLNKQRAEYADAKAEHFSVSEILSDLDAGEMNRILSIFGANRQQITSERKKLLVLTENLVNLNRITYEQQQELYTLLIDYFAAGYEIYIKPHPNDLMDYNTLFPGCHILPGFFPSELISCWAGQKFEAALAVSSTAIDGIGSFVQKVIRFNPKMQTGHKIIHRYYAASKLVKSMDAGLQIKTAGCNDKLLCEFFQTDIQDISLVSEVSDLLEGAASQPAVYIFDDSSKIKAQFHDIADFLNKLHSDSAVIFINSHQDYCYYNGENDDVFANIRPIIIQKSYDENYKKEEEAIYMYSNNEDIKKIGQEICCEKELAYTGLKINITGISHEERIKIKALEGVLEATQNRLKGYIALQQK